MRWVVSTYVEVDAPSAVAAASAVNEALTGTKHTVGSVWCPEARDSLWHPAQEREEPVKMSWATAETALADRLVDALQDIEGIVRATDIADKGEQVIARIRQALSGGSVSASDEHGRSGSA